MISPAIFHDLTLIVFFLWYGTMVLWYGFAKFVLLIAIVLFNSFSQMQYSCRWFH